MSTTVLSIYNGAISAAHGKGRLTSLSQNSRERDECDTWYPAVRDQVQEAAYWPGCRTTNALSLLGEAGTSWVAGSPESGFAYSYGLPDDYLRAWHLVDFSTFTLSFDPTRNRTVLNTNSKDAILVYACRQENPVHWTAGQRWATIHALAAAIVGPLTGQSGLDQLNYQKANEFITAARAVALNTQNLQYDSLPPELAARGYTAELSFPTRYYYPLGGLFGAVHG